MTKNCKELHWLFQHSVVQCPRGQGTATLHTTSPVVNLARGCTYTSEYRIHGTACQKSAEEIRTGKAMTTDSDSKRGTRAEGSRKRKRTSAWRTDTAKRSVPVYMNCDCKKNRKIRKYFLTFNQFCDIIQSQSSKAGRRRGQSVLCCDPFELHWLYRQITVPKDSKKVLDNSQNLW